MKVKVLLFAQMRVEAGRGEIELDLPEGARLDQAIELLFEIVPRLKEHHPSCMTAVGVDYVPANHPLADGDEISLIPPVQGG